MPARKEPAVPAASRRIIAIGASWGGLDVISCLLGGLPADFACPIVLVQHRHRDSGPQMLEVLAAASRIPIREPEDKDTIGRGAHLAPANYHLLLEEGYFNLSVDPPVRGSRPSIDVLCSSAADAYGARVIGVILTGANADGAEGLAAIHRAGGLCCVQAPDTAENPTMPKAALQAVPSAAVLPVERIASWLVESAGRTTPAPRE